MITDRHFTTFSEQARRVGAERLQHCSSGNVSWRVAEDIALVSGTGSWMSRLTKEQVAVCEISTGNHIGGASPSMECRFHLGVLRMREDIDVVLHVQSEYATIIACMEDKPSDFNVTAEVPCYCGREIAVIPYLRPGSEELAVAVIEAMRGHDCALLGNHGQVVCGRDFCDAIQKAVFFEMACRIIVGAGSGGYRTLSKGELDELDAYLLGKSHELLSSN